MFHPDSSDTIRVEAAVAELLSGDSVRYQRKEGLRNFKYRYWVEPSATTWDRTKGAKLKVDFRINSPGQYYLWLRISPQNSEQFIWLEYSNRVNGFGLNDKGLFKYPGPETLTNNWGWSNSFNTCIMNLSAGDHSLKIHSITAGLKIQGLIIAPISSSPYNSDSDINFNHLFSETGDLSKPALIYPRNTTLFDGRIIYTPNNATVQNWGFDLGTTAGADDFLPPERGIPASQLVYDITKSTYALGPLHVRFWTRQGGTWTNNGDTAMPTISFDTQVQNYAEWLRDSRNDKYRVMLVELDHSSGTLRSASKAWVDMQANVAYLDNLINSPYLEESLFKENAIGDVNLVNLRDENWLDLKFRGRRCRWYFGDERWSKDQFRLIAGSIINDIEQVVDGTYRFNLQSEVYKFDRRVVDFDVTESHTGDVDSSVQWLLGKWALSGDYQYLNIPEADMQKVMKIDVDENSTMKGVLDDIATSINAYYTVNAMGVLNYIKPNIDNDSIAKFTENRIDNARRVTVTSTINAVEIINLKYSGGNVQLRTEGESETRDQELEVSTLLRDQSAANDIAEELRVDYSEDRRIFEMGILRDVDSVSVGDVVTVDNEDMLKTGIVTHIRRTPLSSISIIEVMI